MNRPDPFRGVRRPAMQNAHKVSTCGHWPATYMVRVGDVKHHVCADCWKEMKK